MSSGSIIDGRKYVPFEFFLENSKFHYSLLNLEMITFNKKLENPRIKKLAALVIYFHLGFKCFFLKEHNNP
ncbi:hypothetical protein LguiB_004013 [Lonicera macranthoides]